MSGRHDASGGAALYLQSNPTALPSQVKILAELDH